MVGSSGKARENPTHKFRLYPLMEQAKIAGLRDCWILPQ
jgi:hypothetical protein